MPYSEDERADGGTTNSFFDNDDGDSVALLDEARDLVSDFENNINDGCRGSSSLTAEYSAVRTEIDFDFVFMDSMERELALEFLRDKLEIRRGMRGDDPNPLRVFEKLTKEQRRAALDRVKCRVRKIRQQRHVKKSTPKKKVAVKRVSKLRNPTAKQTLRKSLKRKTALPLRPKNVY